MRMLLAYEKHGVRVFDISSPEKREKVVLMLFNERRKLGYYNDLVRMESLIYKEARKGNAFRAEAVLLFRSNYEYERIELTETEEV